MTVAEILVGAYLIVGLLAAVLIWTALRASKRHHDKAKKVNCDYLEYSPFGEPNVASSRFR